MSVHVHKSQQRKDQQNYWLPVRYLISDLIAITSTVSYFSTLFDTPHCGVAVLQQQRYELSMTHRQGQRVPP